MITHLIKFKAGFKVRGKDAVSRRMNLQFHPQCSAVHHFGDRAVQLTPVHNVQCTLCISKSMRMVNCMHHSMNWWFTSVFQSAVHHCWHYYIVKQCFNALFHNQWYHGAISQSVVHQFWHQYTAFECAIPQTNSAMFQSVVQCTIPIIVRSCNSPRLMLQLQIW